MRFNNAKPQVQCMAVITTFYSFNLTVYYWLISVHIGPLNTASGSDYCVYSPTFYLVVYTTYTLKWITSFQALTTVLGSVTYWNECRTLMYSGIPTVTICVCVYLCVLVCECPYVTTRTHSCMCACLYSAGLVCIYRRVRVCERCSPLCRPRHYAIWRGNRVWSTV